MPAGRILSGVGRGTTNTLYNCFVLGVGDHSMPRDSREAIMHTVSRMVEITSRGGGVGVNWGALRPAGVRISGVDGESSGAVSWMRGADQMVDSIRQGGSPHGGPDVHPAGLAPRRARVLGRPSPARTTPSPCPPP